MSGKKGKESVFHSFPEPRAVNRDALAIMGAGVAFAVGAYASSIEGPNGVPAHPLRHRSAMGP